jgi:hypothetical protein
MANDFLTYRRRFGCFVGIQFRDQNIDVWDYDDHG